MAITVERLEAEVTADTSGALRDLAQFEAALDVVARDRKMTVEVDLDAGGAMGGAALGGFLQSLQGIGTQVVQGLGSVVEQIGAMGKAAGSAQGALQGAADAVGQVGEQAGKSGGQIGEAVGMLGKIGGYVGMVVSAVASFAMMAGTIWVVYAAATALTGAIQALAGAIGALIAIVGSLAGLLATIPVLLGAIGGGALTVIAGMQGITETLGLMDRAQSASTRSTFSATQAARDLKSARMGLADANKAVIRAEEELKRATENVAKAQEQAAKDMIQRRRDVRDAIWAEQDAVWRLQQAQENLAKAQSKVSDGAQDVAKETDYFTGKVYEVARVSSDATSGIDSVTQAQRDLIHAQEDVERATERRTDAEEALRESEKKGIKNADIVVDAIRRQEDAQNALVRAHDNVAAAQERVNRVLEENARRAAGGAAANDALAAAMKKLSPAGRDFVKFLHDEFMPALSGVQKKAQEGLLPGVQKGLQSLIDSGFFKTLGDELKLFGQGLGTFFEGLMKDLGSKQAQQDIKDMGKLFREVLFGTFKDGKKQSKGLLDAVKPLLSMFVSLTKAAGPATKQLVDLLVTGLEKISAWMEKPENQKAMSDFFESGVDMLKAFIPLLVPLGKIFVDIVKAATPLAKDILASIGDWLKQTSDDLDKPGGFAKLQKFFEDMQPLIMEFGGMLKDLFVTLFTIPAGGKESPFVALMKGIREQVIPALGQLLSVVSKDPKAAKDLMTFIGALIRSLSWFIEHRSQIAMISPALNGIRLSILLYKGLNTLFDWFHTKWTNFWADVNVSGLGGAIQHVIESVLSTAWRAFAKGMNWIIDRYNDIPLLPDLPWRVPIAIGGGKAEGKVTSGRINVGGVATNVGQRAGGGPVEAGEQYIVGERRPELLTLHEGGGGVITSKVPSQFTRSEGAGISADELDRILNAVLEKAKPNVDMEVNMAEPVSPKLLADQIAWSIR